MKKHLLILILILIMFSPSSGNQKIKEPNVSGQFYTSNPEKLKKEIKSYFDRAALEPTPKDVKVLIAPHAGYIYSGHVAAYGYKAVSNKKFNTVIVMAPSHYFHLDGASIWSEGGYKTPLGTLEVDEALARDLLAADDKFVVKPEVFEREHSVEVQLPFIQETFPGAKVVPIIVGQINYDTCVSLAAGLKKAIAGRDDILLVISTDMSHFYNDATARRMDGAALKLIEQMDANKLFTQCYLRKVEMCGFMPVTIALIYAQENGIKDVDILKYANSGDVTRDKSNVVGYTAVIISKGEEKAEKKAPAEDPAEENSSSEGSVKPLTMEEKRKLIEIAKQTIEEFVRNGKRLDFEEADPRLSEEEGAFVTIHKNGRLRGCIGNIIGQGPLYKTVRDMAIAAASSDPRFVPVKKNELPEIDVEISVLSKPQKVTDPNKIIMGTHGVIVSRGLFNKGVFLPQVATETGWGREEFLSNLCSHKAGLPANAWKDPSTKLESFTAEVFSEEDIRSK